ncbi:MAG: undecaprenyl-diphosphate phosphatase [Lysobacterales bacterium]|jgi:undecaprenyl-diphosphatase
MSLIQILVLSLVQGLTEFLPVSSSAHLILGGKVFGWPDQGLVFDVATHLGTLFAVLFYFRSDLSSMVGACLARNPDEGGRRARAMAAYIAVASVPALLLGYFAHDLVETYLRDVRVIAGTTIGFGLLLWAADRFSPSVRPLESMGLRSVVLIGLAQALALVPGTSRSGITITAGRALGFTPDAAARFSFLISIPVIAAAGAYGMLSVAQGEAPIDWTQFLLALLFSALAGWVCIAAFLALLQRVGLLPFVLYRLLLGIVLLWIAF